MIDGIIKKLEKEIDLRKNMSHPYEQVDICYGLNRAKELVSTFEESTWIPISEKLPESYEMVLVTCKTKKGVCNVNRAYYSDGSWHGSGSMSGVIAWTPIINGMKEWS